MHACTHTHVHTSARATERWGERASVRANFTMGLVIAGTTVFAYNGRRSCTYL